MVSGSVSTTAMIFALGRGRHTLALVDLVRDGVAGILGEQIMSTFYYVMSSEAHDTLVSAAFRSRGYTADEAAAAARFSNMASAHGIRTHNAIKALHLDEHLGSRAGGCVPGAAIEKLPSRFKAVAAMECQPQARHGGGV